MSSKVTVETKDITITTTAGHDITATVFYPDGISERTVIIAPGMGVPAGYYRRFASWLASVGSTVITFDYFGMGRSLLPSAEHPRDVDVDITAWATSDCAAVIDRALSLHPRRPLCWIGHSLGGQILGLIPNIECVSQIITIAAGSGYWRIVPLHLRWRALLFWNVIVPSAVWLVGYYPGQALGVFSDLPRGVIRQWRTWCLHPQYAIGVESDTVRLRSARISCPLVVFGFSDDEMVTREGLSRAHSHYLHAQKKMIILDSWRIPCPRIGHFGFFREGYRESLWETYLLKELRGFDSC